MSRNNTIITNVVMYPAIAYHECFLVISHSNIGSGVRILIDCKKIAIYNPLLLWIEPDAFMH
ncbi:TPA: hypothetical protein ENS27_02440 [bacterium]|nr:hypothetical protein [bacterium]